MDRTLDVDYEVVGEIDEPNLCYEFNTLRVYRRLSDRKLFYATDSGCSCPIPFEDTTVADLLPYSEREVRAWARNVLADPSSLIALCGEDGK